MGSLADNVKDRVDHRNLDKFSHISQIFTNFCMAIQTFSPITFTIRKIIPITTSVFCYKIKTLYSLKVRKILAQYIYITTGNTLKELWRFQDFIPVDTGRKLNVHKTFRRCPGCLLNVLCTFNLRPVSAGMLKIFYSYKRYKDIKPDCNRLYRTARTHK